jgi:ribonuclease E
MREEPRRDDVYAWSRPRVPEGDPYIWMDAAQIAGGGARPAGEAPYASAALAEAPPPDTAFADAPADDAPEVDANVIPFPAPNAAETVSDGPVEELWVELPAAAEPAAKPARARRSRAKAKAAAEVVDAPAEVEPVALEAAPAPQPEPEPEPFVKPEPVATADAPEPAEASPAPVTAADEISSPPEKPKRGWWRRNG